MFLYFYTLRQYCAYFTIKFIKFMFSYYYETDVTVNQRQLFLFYCNQCKRFNAQQMIGAINCQLKTRRILLTKTIYY